MGQSEDDLIIKGAILAEEMVKDAMGSSSTPEQAEDELFILQVAASQLLSICALNTALARGEDPQGWLTINFQRIRDEVTRLLADYKRGELQEIRIADPERDKSKN